MRITRHPAPGIGDILPGWFAVPQNPLVPAKYHQSIGELLAATFVVPQNPIMDANTSNSVGKPAQCSTCGPVISGGGVSGLGSLGMFESFDPRTWGMLEWAVVAGGGLLVLSMLRPGRSAYREELSRAKAAYRDTVAKVKRKYPRVGARVGRAVSAARGAL